MNREIKFRGKRVDNGEWVYGSYQADVMALNKHTIIYSDSEGYYCEDEVIPETVGQYTGLKDKNGVKIFEGDIIRVFYPSTEDENGFDENMVAEWSSEYIGYRFKDKYNDAWHITNTTLEVIGNIHDNPELLEVQDEN